MIVNKTIEYKRYNKKYLKENDNVIANIGNVDNIRLLLETIKKDIVTLKIKQEKHCLPSFISKNKRKEEIDKHKKHINANMSMLEKEIRSIKLGNEVVDKNIKEYFFNKLKKRLYEYRNVQQEFLKKIDFYAEYDTTSDDTLEESENEMFDNVREVRSSIYDLTTLLLEIKMVINKQSYFIDRIDFYYDSSNVNIEAVNNELEKIPNQYNDLKNKIICVLLVVVSILLIFVVLKNINKEH